MPGSDDHHARDAAKRAAEFLASVAAETEPRDRRSPSPASQPVRGRDTTRSRSPSPKRTREAPTPHLDPDNEVAGSHSISRANWPAANIESGQMPGTEDHHARDAAKRAAEFLARVAAETEPRDRRSPSPAPEAKQEAKGVQR